jgi:hypothetical protein
MSHDVTGMSHDVTGMYVVMAAVDEFVTLLDGQHPSKWLSYVPRLLQTC